MQQCSKSSGIMLNDVYRYILPFCSTLLYTQDVLGGVKFEPVSTAAAVNEPLAKNNLNKPYHSEVWL